MRRTHVRVWADLTDGRAFWENSKGKRKKKLSEKNHLRRYESLFSSSSSFSHPHPPPPLPFPPLPSSHPPSLSPFPTPPLPPPPRLLCFFLKQGLIVLCPSWPGICNVDQDVLKLTEILPLLPKWWSLIFDVYLLQETSLPQWFTPVACAKKCSTKPWRQKGPYLFC